jgi:hypothetical protein
MKQPAEGASCAITYTVGTYCDFPSTWGPSVRCACDAMTLTDDWECQAPASPCPIPRPRIGTACTPTSANGSCNYGYCAVPGGNYEGCNSTSSMWEVLLVPGPTCVQPQ